MKENNFWGLKKWRRPEGRPISISSYSLPDYTWSSVLLNRCALLRKPPCKHRGALTATKITKIALVANSFCVRYAPYSAPMDVELAHLNLTSH